VAVRRQDRGTNLAGMIDGQRELIAVCVPPPPPEGAIRLATACQGCQSIASGWPCQTPSLKVAVVSRLTARLSRCTARSGGFREGLEPKCGVAPCTRRPALLRLDPRIRWPRRLRFSSSRHRRLCMCPSWFFLDLSSNCQPTSLIPWIDFMLG
jgi:hypothetical protein